MNRPGLRLEGSAFKPEQSPAGGASLVSFMRIASPSVEECFTIAKYDAEIVVVKR